MPRRCRNGALLMAASIVILAPTVGVSRAEDTVTVATGNDRQGRSKQSGEVLQYNGNGLVLRTSRGRKTTIDADRVVAIETNKSPSHRKGDAARAANDFEAALQHYQKAVTDQEEQRGWVQRMLLASMLECHHALGRHDEAGRLFVKLVEDDSRTPYFDQIPLAWTTGQQAGDRQIIAWLASRQGAVRLLGASYALATPRRDAAIKILQQLSTDKHPTIVRLAEAQLWRTIPQADEDDIERWESVIRQLPANLQAGPYHVLGRGLATAGQHRRAALAHLRVRIVLRATPSLAAESLLQAGKSLVAIQQFDEARRIYAELIQEFPKTTAAAEAKQHVESLNQQSKKPS